MKPENIVVGKTKRHIKALVSLGIFLLALAISTVIVATLVGLGIWLLGEGVTLCLFSGVCVVGLYIRYYNDARDL